MHRNLSIHAVASVPYSLLLSLDSFAPSLESIVALSRSGPLKRVPSYYWPDLIRHQLLSCFALQLMARTCHSFMVPIIVVGAESTR